MRRKITAALLFAALVGGVLTAQPASAVQEGSVEFAGTANVAGGLLYPGIEMHEGPCTVWTKVYTKTAKTKTKTTTNTLPGCRNTSWSFGSATCVDTHTTALKPGKAPAAAGACFIGANGQLSGFCGSSSGEGTGIFIDAQGQLHTFRIVWTESAGGTLPITGQVTKESTGQTGPIVSTVTAIPVPVVAVPFQNSCSNPAAPATDFTITGTAAYLEGPPEV